MENVFWLIVKIKLRRFYDFGLYWLKLKKIRHIHCQSTVNWLRQTMDYGENIFWFTDFVFWVNNEILNQW